MPRIVRRRKKPWKRKKYYKKSVQKQINSLRKIVHSTADKRWQDKAWTLSLVDSAGELLDLCSLATIGGGDKPNDRQGNVIHIKSINFHGQVFAPQSTESTIADATSIVRFILCIVHKTRGADPDVDQILQQDGLPPTSGPSVFSHYKKDSEVKYTKLWDRSYQLGRFPFHKADGSNILGSTRPATMKFNFKHTFKGAGLRVEYLNDAEAAPVTNQIYLLSISDSTVTPHPAFVGVVRTNYYG